jgi:hypothetical protein
VKKASTDQRKRKKNEEKTTQSSHQEFFHQMGEEGAVMMTRGRGQRWRDKKVRENQRKLNP